MSWTRFFRRDYWDRERARELEAYLEIETDENIARGLPPREARYAAHRKLGNPALIREEIYHMNSVGFVETLWQDLRHGARLLRLSPGFAFVAIASLALGIGANTAIFQLLDAIRLRTLPVKNARELAEVRIADMAGIRGSINSSYSPLTNALWERVRDQQQAFSGVFAWANDGFNLAAAGEARNARGLWVSGDFFRTLGVQPVLGRVFTVADDRRGCGSPGAVISYSFWQREFGGGADALGKKLSLDGHPVEVIGVATASFSGLEVGRPFDVVLPLCSQPALREYGYLADGAIWWLAVMGRLKPGWTIERAAVHLAAISPGIFEATLPAHYPQESVKDYLGYKLSAVSAGNGISWLRETYSDPLWMLLAIAGLVLLIACANLANLMLARASAREREIAVRLALGATRGRLIRQLLAESLLLAAIGAVGGAFLAQNLSQLLVSFLSTEGNTIFVDLSADWRVFGFTATLAVLTCILFGWTPALRATRTAPACVLKSGGRGMTAGRERFGLRRALVGCQVALSLVLLFGALLFSRSLWKLSTLDAGFRQDGILIANLEITRLKVPVGRWDALKQLLLDRIRTLPGVDSAADAKIIPLSGSASDDHVWMEASDSSGRINPYFNWISPNYFKTLATPFLAGRDFDARDTRTSPRVAIVNQAFTRRLSIGMNPVGKRFRREATPSEPEVVFEIVGLVKNAKYRDLREDFTPNVFLPMPQNVSPEPSMQILIRSSAPLPGLVTGVKRAVGEVSPVISLEFQVFATQIREGLLRERLMATLSGFFGLLAAVLATIGLYGAISYMVARRTNEIGVRMALGADRRDVLRMILREAGTLVALGVTAGSVLALAAAWTARSMLFGLQPYDPPTLIMSAAALAAVALAASYLPARRAAKLDPMVALHDE